MLFPTTLVGSYPQPDWLIDRESLAGRFPPRVRLEALWRVAPEHLAEAQDDATRVAIREQEEAGLDIVTDGEIRRESYSNRFATALEGVDIDNPGEALDRSGHPNPVPRVTGRIRRLHPVQVDDVRFMKAHTDRQVKITVPGPFTMSQQAQNDFFGSEAEMAMDAVNAALDGIDGTTALHICFGYAAIIHERPSGYSFLPELAGCACRQISIETAQSNLDCSVLETLPGKQIMVGCIDLSTHEVETPETVAERVRRALAHMPKENVILAPDCGMKYLPRDAAFGKLRAMVEAAKILRAEHA